MSRTKQVKETTVRIGRVSSQSRARLQRFIESEDNLLYPVDFRGQKAQYPVLMFEILETSFCENVQIFKDESQRDENGNIILDRVQGFSDLLIKVNDRPGVELDHYGDHLKGWSNLQVSTQTMAKLFEILGYPDGTGIMSEDLHLAEVIKDGNIKAFVESLYWGQYITRLDPEYMLMAYQLARRLVATTYKRAKRLKKNQDRDIFEIINESVLHACSFVRETHKDYSEIFRSIELFGVELPDGFEETVVKVQIFDLTHSLLINNQEMPWWKNEVLGIPEN